MLKRLMMALALLVAVVAVMPAFAQDMTPEPTTLPTIAETVVAAAQGNPAEFSTLLTAVQAADPAVLEKLSDPKAGLVVFAPTDAAFAALKEQLGDDAFNAVLADKEALTNILLYHVIEAPTGTDMSPANMGSINDMASTLQMVGGTLGLKTLLGQSVDLAVDKDGKITVDGANIVTADIATSNGQIEVIDKVLLPETRTIAEIASDMAADKDAPQFTSLMAAVGAADPSVATTLSDPKAQLTVFAPTDDAFAALGSDTLKAVLADQQKVTDILLYHVLPQNVHAYDLFAEMDMMTSVMSDKGLSVDTALKGQQVTLKATLDDNGSLLLAVNDAKVVMRDIDAANGVIHVIDSVLLPSA
jgi:transforming growth factor-beta-induced protein